MQVSAGERICAQMSASACKAVWSECKSVIPDFAAYISAYIR